MLKKIFSVKEIKIDDLLHYSTKWRTNSDSWASEDNILKVIHITKTEVFFLVIRGTTSFGLKKNNQTDHLYHDDLAWPNGCFAIISKPEKSTRYEILE